jgi:hypothetical protein
MFIVLKHCKGSGDTADCYGLNNPDFESGQGKDSFLFFEASRLALRPTQPKNRCLPQVKQHVTKFGAHFKTNLIRKHKSKPNV